MDKPPAFTVVATEITRDNYAKLARQYYAGNLISPPDASLSVSTSASLALTGEDDKSIRDKEEQWTTPNLSKQLDVTIPGPYAASSVTIAATAMPKLARWRTEAQELPAKDMTFIEGFHQITLTVAAGGDRLVHQKGAYEPFERFSVQISPELGWERRPSVYFGDAHLATPEAAEAKTTIKLDQVRGVLSLSVGVAGASAAAVSAEVKCKLRDEGSPSGRTRCMIALLDSWRAL